ncbi:CRTAC1 family protein [Tabrizicola sp. J26]|uniref:CRTAC1 family protein n=1 Tax=Alitabrizicola rongguiensis TaxID=2909234 RepID=UPI001F298EEF|nr:CRTAC1 family protein [Tabrizicola rongguiensis]MCF1710830.1 CRTAC1 family protein [Tabrizicola rongguiensis]
MRVIAVALPSMLLAGPLAAADLPLIPSFTEETTTAGVDSIYSGDWEYMVGGGAAVFDCSGDGFPDLFLAGGEGKAGFWRNASARGGQLRFEKTESGLELDHVTGAYPLDIDSDGIMDLVLLRVGENLVMRGEGQCRFTPANSAWGFDGGDAWSTALAATWEKGNSWPTIAIGNYIDRTQDAFPWGSCTANWLHRPNVGGTGFAPPVALEPSYCALSMLFTDWNLSGTPSLRVSNDREYYKGGQEQMWKVLPGQPPVLYTKDEGWKYLRIWGMGIASADVTGDGYPDYFLASMADNKLQTLATPLKEGEPVPGFADVAFARGATAHRPYTGGDVRPSTAWHAQFEDVNNDGWPDLFVAKGNVSDMPDFARNDPNNLMLMDDQGKFHEVGDKAGVASMAVSRGGALADLNLDGLIDLVVVNRHSPAQIWRNTTIGAGHWLGLKPVQAGANPDAVGGWVEVRTGDRVQRRELTAGGGHASGVTGWWHAGLGPVDQAEVRVIWPDGVAGDWEQVAADTLYVIDRDKGAQEWTP